jgi:hypothetical protein
MLGIRVVSFMPSPIYPQGKTPQYPSGSRFRGSQRQSLTMRSLHRLSYPSCLRNLKRQFKGTGIQSVAIFSKHENHLNEKFTKICPNVYKHNFNASIHKAYSTSRKVAGSNPDEVIGFFSWPNPSSRTMSLRSTQPLTEMSTRNLPGCKGRPERKADNLTAICEPTV